MATTRIEQLWTITDAASLFGTTVATIRGLIQAHGIETKPVPRNGKARGLNYSDMQVLALALGRQSLLAA